MFLSLSPSFVLPPIRKKSIAQRSTVLLDITCAFQEFKGYFKKINKPILSDICN